jgi:hypothetical protein
MPSWQNSYQSTASLIAVFSQRRDSEGEHSRHYDF